ncbi:MAG: ATP-binding cassette domain-containing protein [Clostridiales bacterium]|nr:ATP-binding cassette domain-containing protein [Clostridiales bacterium]
MLEVHIEKRLDRFCLKVDLETGEGLTGLLGSSGCGKSMTLKCVAGLVTPDSGRIVLDGRTLFDAREKINLPPQKRQVGYLFQNYALFPTMTAAENVRAGVRDRSRASAQAEALMERFRIADLADKYPRQLSGGQQQRVALARLFASQPRALLLDEPFSALDGYLRWEMELELAGILKDFDGPAVLVTHDRGEVYRLCRTACVLDHGRSEPMQEVRDLFETPRTRAACLLSGCKNLSRAIPLGGSRVEAADWGVTLDTGREVPPDTRWLGIREGLIRPGGGENPIPCRVDQVVEDLTATVVMLATPGPARLRLELPKGAWSALGGPETLTISLPAQNLMLLR